jgi:pimeloyl-ACP methyl ester carboxylesterase
LDTPRNPLYLTSSAGYRLAYEWIEGTLPAVVFLGGYRSDMYGTKGEWLAAHCRERGRAFLRLDYSGHGMSEGRFEDGTIGGWTGDALEVIGAANPQRMVLVGSSMGGWIMLLAALELADRVEGLLGIAAAPDFTRDLMWNVFDEATRSRIRSEGRVVLPSQYDESGYPVSHAFIEDGERRLLLDKPIPLRCPVRLMHGRRDPDVPWQTAERIEKQLETNDVTITYYKDGDHRLSQPRFLEEISRQLEALL